MTMFNQETLIKTFFKTDSYEVEKLNKALTNDN